MYVPPLPPARFIADLSASLSQCRLEEHRRPGHRRLFRRWFPPRGNRPRFVCSFFLLPLSRPKLNLFYFSRGLYHSVPDHRPNQGHPTVYLLHRPRCRRARSFRPVQSHPNHRSNRSLLFQLKAMFGDPFDNQLVSHITPLVKASLANASESGGEVKVHEGKTVVVMEGPQFSTRAESLMFVFPLPVPLTPKKELKTHLVCRYRQWGGDIINMSSIPEAKLAREAEIPYALICTSTDYDAWRAGEAPVTVEEVRSSLFSCAAHRNVSLSLLAHVHAHRSSRPSTPTRISLRKCAPRSSPLSWRPSRLDRS